MSTSIASIPQLHAGGDVASLDRLLQTCIHCGLCLSACPTYLVTGDEAESPRGRILLMYESMAEAAPAHSTLRLAGAAFDRRPIDRCLGCRNCETVCPSGVRYGHLLERTRTALGRPQDRRGQVVAWVVDHVLAYPRRTAIAVRLGRLARPLRRARFAPALLKELLEALPSLPTHAAPSARLGHEGDVALLAGCAQQVFTPDVLHSAARLVRAAGAAPYLPPHQGCCGALSHHVGSVEQARRLARQTVDAFADAPAIVVPSAGCSAHMREYGQLLADDSAYAERAAQVAARTIDLVEWLDRHLVRPVFSPCTARVVYHPPCHHTHAQRITEAPLRLLRRVPQLTLLSPRDAERCCGSAGSYNLLHPQLAHEVRDQKLDAIEESAGDLLVTANPGCELFLKQGLMARDSQMPVQHLAVFLAELL